MFKKTRLRIFALIMMIATIIITLMLTIIYVANSNNSFERSISLLESFMEESPFLMPPDKEVPRDRPEFRPEMGEKHNKMYELSTFYSVHYDMSGNVIDVNCSAGNLYTEEEILDMANSIMSKGKARGRYNKMPFLVRTVKDGTVVALIDNTMEEDNYDRLFKNCIIVGFFTWLIVLALSCYFSHRIVGPLERNDNQQKQFISDAGHELKTPISVISANAELLALEVGENKWLSNIQYENERMGELVKQLLDLVRAENMQVNKETLDFSRLVSGDALPFESIAFEKGHSLNMEIEKDIVVNGNRNQLSQLTTILLDNAIQHSTAKGDITVKLYSEKNNAVLSVQNPGEPISEKSRERLFERFYREDEARTGVDGHYGLGLAIAKAITTAHNGKIELDCYDGLVEFKFTISRTSNK